MTDTRDWDHEEAKTKVGEWFVCLTNVRHSFICCPVFDMLTVWKAWGSDPWLGVGWDTGLQGPAGTCKWAAISQSELHCSTEDVRQASMWQWKEDHLGLMASYPFALFTGGRGVNEAHSTVNHSWPGWCEEWDDGQGQAQWSVIPRYKHPGLISILARGNRAVSSDPSLTGMSALH